jgi:hypothetical protein
VVPHTVPHGTPAQGSPLDPELLPDPEPELDELVPPLDPVVPLDPPPDPELLLPLPAV